MAKTPNLGDLPKNHRIGSAAEEEADRSIHRADEQNWRFYQEAQQSARNVSEIQAGVNESVARALTQGMHRPDAVQEQVKRERVQSELYRAVQGNEFYETGGVPDPAARNAVDNKNYLASENHEHLSGIGRLGRRWSRLWRGAASMVGANNFVENSLARRFGENQEIEARRLFVAERCRPLLNEIANVNPPGLNFISNQLGLPVYVLGTPLNAYLNMLIPALAEAQTSQLMEMLRNVPQLNQNIIFADLMMLVDLDQRETVKIGIEGVYNPERLRFFWDERLTAGGEQANLMNRLVEILTENSLFPFDKNPDGMALMAEIEARFNRYIAEHPAVPLPDRQEDAATELLTLINEIVNNELPLVNQPNEQITNRINEINQTVTQIRQTVENVVNGFHNAQALAGQIALQRAGLAGIIGAARATAQSRIDADETTLTTRKTEVMQQQNNLVNQVLLLQNRLNGINPAALPVCLTDIINTTRISDINLNSNTGGTPPTPDIINHLTNAGQRADLEVFFNNSIPNDYLNRLQNRERVSPFVILQRLTRRSYCEERGMNPANLMDEEVNRYATLAASMRVQDAKNADLLRNSNRKAAEFLRQGLASRGVDKVKSALIKTQNLVGFEPINFKERTEDVIIEQIINSREEFTPFRGINKYSTTRDIREIINNTDREVAIETIERFIQMLEEAVSEFKKGKKSSKDFGVIAGDWDIENLIIVLQKLKSEKWTQELMQRLKAEGVAGNRELAFVRLLQEQRALEQRIADEIRNDVKYQDAIWKKLLIKDELKKVLNESSLDSLIKLRTAGIAAKNKEIERLTARMAALPDRDPNKNAKEDKIKKQIENLHNDIAEMEKEMGESRDLYDRVSEAKEYIANNKLSRKEQKAYIQAVGLEGVWDKMSSNFRLERYWNNTKKAAEWTWDKTKGLWNWSRKKVINTETARKVESVGRLLASPITIPLGWAWKAGTFPFRLAGRSLMWTAKIPGKSLRYLNDSALRSYLLKKPIEMNMEIENLAEKIVKLQLKQSKAPYKRDKARIARQIADLNIEVQKITVEYAKLQAEAARRKLPIASLNIGSSKAPEAGEEKKK